VIGHEEGVKFCATGALLHAGFELTADFLRACELRDAACERLLPALPIPRLTLEELNDTSIGHVTVLQVFDEYPEHSAA
jgi:hypothetical protein